MTSIEAMCGRQRAAAFGFESVVEPAPLSDAVKEGIRRIEDVATGRVAGLIRIFHTAATATEEQLRS